MAQPAAAARRRWWRQQRRDGEMKTVWGGAEGEWRGGELKGTEAGGGALRKSPPLCLSLLWTTSLLLSPQHPSPQFRLPWSCHGNRRQDQARRVGLREGRRERELSRASPAKTRCSGYIVGGSQLSGFTTLISGPRSPDPAHPRGSFLSFPQNFLQASSRTTRCERELYKLGSEGV